MEKLSEEVKLFEDMVKFMEKISVSNEKVTMDDLEFLSVARNNVNGVHRELCTVISSSSAIDVSLIIKDYRSKVEKELNDICNKVSNLNIKADIKDYIQSFQHDDAVIDDDDNEISAYFKKWNKLYLECDDYEQTLEFLNKLKVIATKEQASEKDLSILNRAYNMIMRVYRALSDTLYSDQSSSVWDIDVSLTVNESRSKVQNELNYICNNVTNHTIKEAISRHLDAFKAGHLPQKLFPRILTDRKRVSSQSDIKTTNKKSKLGSGDGFGYHDHVKSIKKQRVPLYIQINAVFEDSEPDCIGEGFEIQHVDDKSEMALVQHFLMEPLSFTVKGLLDEVVSLDYCSSPLLFYERLEGNLLQCLHEAGKKQKTTLLDLYYEVLDPKLYNLRHSSDHLELKPDSQRPSWIQGINGTSSKMQKGGLIGQTIRQVRCVMLWKWMTKTWMHYACLVTWSLKTMTGSKQKI